MQIFGAQVMNVRAPVFLVLAIAALVSACASSRAIQGPSGRTAYLIKCGGTVDGCYEEAAKLCPKGYNVTDRQSDRNAEAMPAIAWFSAARRHTELHVECKS